MDTLVQSVGFYSLFSSSKEGWQFLKDQSTEPASPMTRMCSGTPGPLGPVRPELGIPPLVQMLLDRGLSVSTIKVYAAAFSDWHNLMGGFSFFSQG